MADPQEPGYEEIISPHIDEEEGIPKQGNWGISAEEIRNMSPDQFREFVIDLHERVGRDI